MRERVIMGAWRGAGVVALALAVALLAGLAGCGHLTGVGGAYSGAEATATAGTSATATAKGVGQGDSGGQARVACVTALRPYGVDTITFALTCQVTGAAPSDTSFTLQYQVASSNGQPHIFTPACVGTLRDGAGSCRQTYFVIAPFLFNRGSVAGSTSPGHVALGPIIPTQITPTPGPYHPPVGPIPTFQGTLLPQR